jgi:hypothetical protein
MYSRDENEPFSMRGDRIKNEYINTQGIKNKLESCWGTGMRVNERAGVNLDKNELFDRENQSWAFATFFCIHYSTILLLYSATSAPLFDIATLLLF